MGQVKDGGTVNKIERVKRLVNIALAGDLFSLTEAMNKKLSAIGGEVSEINDGVTALYYGQQKIGKCVSDISVGVTALTIEQHEEERRKIEEWLSLIDFRSRQHQVFRGAQAGTRQWLFDSEEFQDWIDPDRGTLWCPGTPGAGTIVTSSIIIDYLQSRFKDTNVAVTCSATTESERGKMLKPSWQTC